MGGSARELPSVVLYPSDDAPCSKSVGRLQLDAEFLGLLDFTVKSISKFALAVVSGKNLCADGDYYALSDFSERWRWRVAVKWRCFVLFPNSS